jgi:hypothetical protein
MFTLANRSACRYVSSMNVGPELLREFLEKNQAPQVLAARVLGVSAPCVHDWLARKRTPSAPFRVAMERWTAGAVPAVSWLDGDELELVRTLASVRPLQGLPQDDDGS